MEYEIINPSDPYTMTADDLQIAAAVVCLLGEGKYAAKPTAGAGSEVPMFLFGGHDKWFAQMFGMNFEATIDHVMTHRGDELAQALESVTLASQERSSLNDIGGRAKAMAQAVRRKSNAA